MADKKDSKGADGYYVNTDIGHLKLGGIHFPPGEPVKVPESLVARLDASVNFSESAKKLTPSECERMRRAEFKAAKESRNAWRKDYKAKKAVEKAKAQLPAPETPDKGGE